jgi:hypothetical protein
LGPRFPCTACEHILYLSGAVFFSSFLYILSSFLSSVTQVSHLQSKGSIDSSATDRLAVILSVAEQIGGNPDDINPAETDAPHFLWLIRDSQLQFKNPPKQEMLKMLQRNEKRQLEGFFKTHDCFPLPRPVDSEDKLKVCY